MNQNFTDQNYYHKLINIKSKQNTKIPIISSNFTFIKKLFIINPYPKVRKLYSYMDHPFYKKKDKNLKSLEESFIINDDDKIELNLKLN